MNQASRHPSARPTPRRDRRVRNAEMSRDLILNAAEHLFADHGFQGASLAAIAKKAGVSVGLPGYFFGSKDDLHREVLTRVFERRNAALDVVATEAENLLEDECEGPTAALRRLVAGYIEFLLANPTFVRLLTRDALDHTGPREHNPRHYKAFAERAREIMARAGVRDAEVRPEQCFLSLISMCYFPLEHDPTVVAGMGRRAWTQAFQDERIDHIVTLLAHG